MKISPLPDYHHHVVVYSDFGQTFTRFLLKQFSFFFQAEDGIRDIGVTGVQTCALPICHLHRPHGQTVAICSPSPLLPHAPEPSPCPQPSNPPAPTSPTCVRSSPPPVRRG